MENIKGCGRRVIGIVSCGSRHVFDHHPEITKPLQQITCKSTPMILSPFQRTTTTSSSKPSVRPSAGCDSSAFGNSPAAQPSSGQQASKWLAQSSTYPATFANTPSSAHTCTNPDGYSTRCSVSTGASTLESATRQIIRVAPPMLSASSYVESSPVSTRNTSARRFE